MDIKPNIFEKREQSLVNSEKAIRTYPDEYLEIKAIINRVVQAPVDIDEYYPIAERLARLLEKMGSNTIFDHYYLENVDPGRGCQARYFRYICRDLSEQIDILSHWRKERRQLRVVG